MTEISTAEEKFFQLVHPGGPLGIVMEKPEMQEQDEKFEDSVFYAVVFFPKITGIGNATSQWPNTKSTLSSSPEAAIAKFMDRIKQGETWETYHDAGHRVRKVLLSDLGDAS